MSVCPDYALVLKDCGFDQIPEAEDTAMAFDYEVHASLFETGSPFDTQRSEVRRMPEVLDSMISCKLILLPGKSRLEGLQYLMTQWFSFLRYENPKHESIVRSESVFGTEVKIFTLSRGTGCSFTFTIVDKAGEEAMADFIGGYSAVDNPDAILRKLDLEP